MRGATWRVRSRQRLWRPPAPPRWLWGALFGGVAATGLGWGTVALWRSLDAPVAVVGVSGVLRHVERAEVERLVASHLRGGFLSLDLEGVRRALLDHPWIASARVRRRWPNRLEIEVAEAEPIARWGEAAFLDRSGRLLPAPSAEVAGEEALPRLSGPAGSERRVMREYRNFAHLLAPLGLRIAGLALGSRGDWRVELVGGIRLVAGREPLAPRLARFAAVWRVALAERSAEVAEVDLRYGNGVAVRWRAAAPGEG